MASDARAFVERVRGGTALMKVVEFGGTVEGTDGLGIPRLEL